MWKVKLKLGQIIIAGEKGGQNQRIKRDQRLEGMQVGA